MIKIMFVCLGNICRSPMAEFVFKNMVREKGLEDMFEIASGATSREEIGNDIHIGTRRKLSEKNIPFSKRHAVQLTKADYEYYDYIIAMDRSNLSGIRRIVGEDEKNKVRLLMEYAGQSRDIADPWYTGNFDVTYDDIAEGCAALLDSLTV